MLFFVLLILIVRLYNIKFTLTRDLKWLLSMGDLTACDRGSLVFKLHFLLN